MVRVPVLVRPTVRFLTRPPAGPPALSLPSVPLRWVYLANLLPRLLPPTDLAQRALYHVASHRVADGEPTSHPAPPACSNAPKTPARHRPESGATSPCRATSTHHPGPTTPGRRPPRASRNSSSSRRRRSKAGRRFPRTMRSTRPSPTIRYVVSGLSHPLRFRVAVDVVLALSAHLSSTAAARFLGHPAPSTHHLITHHGVHRPRPLRRTC